MKPKLGAPRTARQHRDARYRHDRDRDGPAHHRGAAWRRQGRATPLRLPGGERIDARSERGEDGGQDDDGADGGERDDADAPRRRTTRRKSIGNTERADSAKATVAAEKTTVRPAVLQRAARRDTGVWPVALLVLAVARDDQQAVVDGEGQPERRRQVDREDRDVGDLG